MVPKAPLCSLLVEEYNHCFPQAENSTTTVRLRGGQFPSLLGCTPNDQGKHPYYSLGEKKEVRFCLLVKVSAPLHELGQKGIQGTCPSPGKKKRKPTASKYFGCRLYMEQLNTD